MAANENALNSLTFKCFLLKPSLSAYTSHSVCDLCVAINAHRKSSKTQAELSLANALFNQHKMDFGMARRSVEEVRQNAIDFPHDVVFIQCDGMDNRQGVTSNLVI